MRKFQMSWVRCNIHDGCWVRFYNEHRVPIRLQIQHENHQNLDSNFNSDIGWRG